MTSSFNLQYIYERWLFSLCYICDVLRDLVCHLHNLKKREKHPWDSVTFSKKPANLLNVKLLHGCFSSFLNCTNGTKSRNASHKHCSVYIGSNDLNPQLLTPK